MSARLRNLGMFALRWQAFGLALCVLVLGLIYWRGEAQTAPYNDFSLTYFAAKIGLAHGWLSVYDRVLQRQAFDALYKGQVSFGAGFYYTNSPIGAWLAVPFIPLSEQAAYWVWSGLMVALTISAWALLAKGSRLERFGILCVILGTYPAIYSFRLGQPVALAVLAVALCYRWLDRRPWAAGAILALAFVKPHLILLLPIGLILTRRFKVLVGAAGAAALTAFLIFVALGPGGVQTMLSTERFEGTVFWNGYLTLLHVLHGGWLGPAGVVLAGLLAVAAAWTNRAEPERWFPALLVGSLLVAPYLHAQDYAMLAPVGMLVLRAFPGLGVRLWLGVGVVLAEFLMPLGPLPILAYQLVSLAWLAVAGLKASSTEGQRSRAPGLEGPAPQRA